MKDPNCKPISRKGKSNLNGRPVQNSNGIGRHVRGNGRQERVWLLTKRLFNGSNFYWNLSRHSLVVKRTMNLWSNALHHRQFLNHHSKSPWNSRLLSYLNLGEHFAYMPCSWCKPPLLLITAVHNAVVTQWWRLQFLGTTHLCFLYHDLFVADLKPRQTGFLTIGWRRLT